MLYFFHTFDNGEFIRDENGYELPNDDSARDEATRFLAEMASETYPGGRGSKYAVEVTDETGRAIATVGFAIQDGPEAIS